MICLNAEYSTTRQVVGIPEASQSGVAAIEGRRCLPPNTLRSGEGGLRLQGHGKSEDEQSGPLVTIITAVFNGEKTIEQTILSVISQSYNNLEYIIIDAGSTDGTIDIIKKYEHAINYWVSEPDGGIYDAWNKGVALASGTWIAFLGSDDLYREGAVQAYIDFVSSRTDLDIEYVSSKINLTNDEKVLRTVGLPWSWEIFRKYMKVAHVGSLHHKKLFEKYGLFDDSYRITGDYEFLLRPGRHLNAYFLDEITVNMHVGGVSNADSRVFEESTRAKISTGGRNVVASQIEKYWAILKWKIRSQLLG
ncbi:glycosyltransferase [Herminiimonas sp. KBW02]|uniref:glycosyltransferase family 2 protein n=1 Tax=Herminiimonas sp. KBW02 TaxID=2153363 RepID=UPI000F5A6E32|nr:glycosyltransferase family 2 protein [Herminiimonas sp. KBW02]RQO36107.1 glycosyltransferase [Herminiimonas sp. KBW02]